jgi:hypothetical protein
VKNHQGMLNLEDGKSFQNLERKDGGSSSLLGVFNGSSKRTAVDGIRSISRGNAPDAFYIGRLLELSRWDSNS